MEQIGIEPTGKISLLLKGRIELLERDRPIKKRVQQVHHLVLYVRPPLVNVFIVCY